MSDVTDRISALLTEFCWRVDQGMGARMAELFTPDGRIDTPNFQVQGHEQIDAWFTGRAGSKRSRHCWTNLRITPKGDDRYLVSTNLITAAASLPSLDDAKIAITTSNDEIVIEDDTAFFASRTLEILFEFPLALAGAPA